MKVNLLKLRSSKNNIDLKTLEKIYIEPTNTCNLKCRTCIRNVWDEQDGFMSKKTFANIIESITQISPLPTVFFGGFGEPLNHPDILKMVAELKGINAKVELITNGILLNNKVSKSLMELGLDRLWVSIDGASPESYLDIRLGSNLPLILANLKELHRLKDLSSSILPKLGIAFVALKHNIADLPEVLNIGIGLGADKFSISNVLPYTPELNEQILYGDFIGAPYITPKISSNMLPPMDIDTDILNSINTMLDKFYEKNSIKPELNTNLEKCPFIDKKSTSIRCDGALSPCLPFMHKHQIFYENRCRTIEPYIVGNINQKTLFELWNNLSYVERRKCIIDFEFPCNMCAMCYYDDSNDIDCFTNNSPACGGCLWAQGLIKCP
jgi:MoaA/NifB/PqqE/SkfB family radical SAM enzyme